MNKLIIVLMIIIMTVIIKYYLNKDYVWDFAKIHSSKPFLKFYPENYNQLAMILKQYPEHQVSIAGTKFSHGGQTMKDNAIYLDLSNLNKILYLNKNRITVQSGITWNKIIESIDKYDLSVSEMQSYSNFSVGGSISVNCHGRGMEYGTIADTIISLKIMTAEGNIIKCYPSDLLFKGVVGGYGGLGIILEAELKLSSNYNIKRVVEINNTANLSNNFNKILKSNKDIVFYNGNIYPKNEEKLINVYYVKTDESITNEDRIQKHKKYYFNKMILEQILRRTHSLKYLRSIFEPKIMEKNNLVVKKNWEMTHDTNTLNVLIKYPTTSILQEYFIPIYNIDVFNSYFWNIINSHKVNLLNVSFRLVKKTFIPILNYAPDDRIAIVLYLNIPNNSRSIKNTKIWTQKLIDMSLTLDGSYYLPYLPLATKDQFKKAYPEWRSYLKIKEKYDPKNRFSNQFLDSYLF